MNQTESYVRARIDSDLKEEANAALKAMGLSMSDFIRLALTRVWEQAGQANDWRPTGPGVCLCN